MSTAASAICGAAAAYRILHLHPKVSAVANWQAFVYPCAHCAAHTMVCILLL